MLRDVRELLFRAYCPAPIVTPLEMMDLAPELVYVSARLAEEVIQRAGQGARLPIADPYELAITAGRLTTGHRGTLEQPDEFVMAPLPIKAWTFSYKADDRRVAWFASDLGTTLVVLIGSAANFIGHQPEEPKSGWWPSSAMGVQRVVNAYAGRANQPSVLFDLDGESARRAASSAAYSTVGLPADAAHDFGACAVLFRRYADVPDLVEGPPFAGRRQFERVVVGAPLMVQRLPAD